MRIGFASDIHELVENRKLILGGIVVPFEKGEKAHSDGDVVFHALGEAILGALALGDLGKHFPDNDDKYLDMDSSKIIEYVWDLMDERNYKIGNIDISISLEKPKIAPYIEQMRLNIANLLNTNYDNVSVKAGTNEKMDAVGEGRAIKADCVVLLIEK